MKVRDLSIFVDSQLVANQVIGLFKARQPNKKAGTLRKLASMTFSQLAKEVLVEVLPEKSIVQREVPDIIKEEGKNWILSALLPKDLQKARKLRVKAPQYRIIDGNLYCKSYTSPWLCCVGPVQAKSIIQYTPRLLRKACRVTISGVEDHEAGILLASDAHRCKSLNPEM
nr:hypothetical protein [Tanacetum cinerariifolium]GEZ11208.1 hypothetical protein [Tanacetum cinerariifolium]